MPVKACRLNNKPGFKYGDEGKCYTYNPNSEDSRRRARAKAEKQGRAIETFRHGEDLSRRRGQDE